MIWCKINVKNGQVFFIDRRCGNWHSFWVDYKSIRSAKGYRSTTLDMLIQIGKSTGSVTIHKQLLASTGFWELEK